MVEFPPGKMAPEDGEYPLVGGHRVEVRRSARRRKTLSAYRSGEKIIVLLPADVEAASEHKLVSEMVARVVGKETSHARSGARASDATLAARARELSERYLGGRARPTSVRWVGNMASRWGSCTMSDRTIRLSRRLSAMPTWVIDYVLMHELTHLLEPAHNARFWDLVAAYPYTERGRGYLEGVAMAAQLPGLSDCEPEDPSSSDEPLPSLDELPSLAASLASEELAASSPGDGVSAASASLPASVRLDTSSGTDSSVSPP